MKALEPSSRFPATTRASAGAAAVGIEQPAQSRGRPSPTAPTARPAPRVADCAASTTPRRPASAASGRSSGPSQDPSGDVRSPPRQWSVRGFPGPLRAIAGSAPGPAGSARLQSADCQRMCWVQLGGGAVAQSYRPTALVRLCVEPVAVRRGFLGVTADMRIAVRYSPSQQAMWPRG